MEVVCLNRGRGVRAPSRPDPAEGLVGFTAAAVQHLQVSDQGFEATAVARRGDHRVRGERRPVRQEHPVAVEGGHGGHGLDPPLAHRFDQAHVLHRDGPLPRPAVQARRGPGEPLRRQVRDRGLRDQRPEPVHKPHRQPADEDPRALRRPAQRRAAHQVRGGAHREPHPGRPALGEVHGYLGAGVADADDQHVPPRVRRGLAVAGGVQQPPGVRIGARPVRQVRGVVEAGGHHHGPGRQQPPAGGVQGPAVPVGGALDPGHLDAGDQLQLVVLGVRLQVPDHVGPRDPAPEAARDRQSGQGRQPPGGVQPQPLVVAPPGGSDRVRLLDDHGPHPAGAQRRGDGESAGSRADHVHGARLGAGQIGCGRGHEE